jgi:hypothetical protein
VRLTQLCEITLYDDKQLQAYHMINAKERARTRIFEARRDKYLSQCSGKIITVREVHVLCRSPNAARRLIVFFSLWTGDQLILDDFVCTVYERLSMLIV